MQEIDYNYSVICKCNFCDKQAKYDGKTIMGPWAYMCEEHYKHYGCRTKGLYTDLSKVK